MRAAKFRLFVCLLGIPLSVWADDDDDKERVLIRSPKPYTQLAARVQAMGGKVTHQFKYLDAIAAEIPPDKMDALRSLLPAGAVTKDEVIPNPAPVDTLRGKGGLVSSGEEDAILADSVGGLAVASGSASPTVNPNGYLINSAIANVSGLHGAGVTGEGIVVAVIDSGIRPGRPHLDSDGSVIGCEDFVPDALNCSDNRNNGHGTFVAGMISANVVFIFSPASPTRNAILAECPACFLNPPTNTQIPMIGTAPLSSIYALRVFGATGGSPTSRILAAMERVIELHQKFKAGDPAGVNIGVCNMSLGGATLFAGRDLFDQAANLLLENDIVLAVAAGNEGPSSITTSSPGTAFGALTVGAASLPHNERILRRLQFGPAVGSLYRPFLGVQSAFFSSRGPNADGRIDPDVTANGFANFGQGFSASPLGLSIASGTSFSTPSVAGVAALQRQAFPGATAKQVRNAIISTGNPNVLNDGSTKLDQGKGYVDGQATFNRLAAGGVSDSFPKPSSFDNKVIENLEDIPFLLNNDEDACGDDDAGEAVRKRLRNLRPGGRADILFCVLPDTKQVVVTLSSFSAELPPSQQNQLFGDDVLLAVHSSKTNTTLTPPAFDDYLVFTFVTGGTFTLNNPEPGLLRVTVNGDWTNAGKVSIDVDIAATSMELPSVSLRGRVSEGQTLVFPVNIPAGVTAAQFQLHWERDWSMYPVSDVDLILVNPNGAPNFNGATLNSPERVTVANPPAGLWFILVDGFEIHANKENFKLRILLDGKVLKLGGGGDEND